MTLVTRTFALLVACGLAACSHATEASLPNAIVTVEAPTLAVQVPTTARSGFAVIVLPELSCHM
jgi:hypothetical protein